MVYSQLPCTLSNAGYCCFLGLHYLRRLTQPAAAPYPLPYLAIRNRWYEKDEVQEKTGNWVNESEDMTGHISTYEDQKFYPTLRLLRLALPQYGSLLDRMKVNALLEATAWIFLLKYPCALLREVK